MSLNSFNFCESQASQCMLSCSSICLYFTGNLWESTIYYRRSQQNRYLPRRIRYEIVTSTPHILNLHHSSALNFHLLPRRRFNSLSIPLHVYWFLPYSKWMTSAHYQSREELWANNTLLSMNEYHECCKAPFGRTGPPPNTVVFSLVISKLLEAFSQVCLVRKDNLCIEELKLRCSKLLWYIKLLLRCKWHLCSCQPHGTHLHCFVKTFPTQLFHAFHGFIASPVTDVCLNSAANECFHSINN